LDKQKLIDPKEKILKEYVPNSFKRAFSKENASKKALKKYLDHVDAGWALKNNKPSYVTLMNPIIINKLTKNISIFDIMTLASLFDIYNEMNWGQIQEN
jgi:hypothetical protein